MVSGLLRGEVKATAPLASSSAAAELLQFSVHRTLAFLAGQGFTDLAQVLRRAEENNPHTSSSSRLRQMWKEQVGLNIPSLVLSCLSLYNWAAEKHKCTRFLFATRDCVHMRAVFQILFPDTKTHYFHCSRNMFNNARTTDNAAYETYVKGIIGPVANLKHTVFVDVHGTGQRMIRYFQKRWGAVPYCFLVSAGVSMPKTLPKECYYWYKKGKLKALGYDMNGSPIEMLNYDTIGSLLTYDALRGPVRAPVEYDAKHIATYHECVSHVVSLMKPNGTDMARAMRNNPKLSASIAWFLKSVARREHLPVISHWITHERSHPTAAAAL